MSGAEQALRDRLATGQLAILGAHDAMSARLACDAGAEGIYVSGYAASATRLGRPDLGLISQTEMAEHIARICDNAVRPVIADADTGYGGALNIQRTVQLWERVGVAGLHLEDQQFPKKCGHIAGKAVIPVGEMVQKLSAAVAGRSDPATFLIARTDAVAVTGLDDALERCKRYADTGVDALFVDAPDSVSMLETIARTLEPLGKTLVFNCARTMKSPVLTAKELEDLGFGLIFYPIEAMLTAHKAMLRTYRTLLETGTTEAVADDLTSFAEFNRFIGLDDHVATETRFAAE